MAQSRERRPTVVVAVSPSPAPTPVQEVPHPSPNFPVLSRHLAPRHSAARRKPTRRSATAPPRDPPSSLCATPLRLRMASRARVRLLCHPLGDAPTVRLARTCRHLTVAVMAASPAASYKRAAPAALNPRTELAAAPTPSPSTPEPRRAPHRRRRARGRSADLAQFAACEPRRPQPTP